MKRLFGFISMFFLLPDALAMNEVEKMHLERLVAELEVAKRIVVEAERSANDSGSVKFDYSALIWDLSEMSSAIDRHINKPSTSPRDVSDLMFDYGGGEDAAK